MFSVREVSRLLAAVDSWNRPAILAFICAQDGMAAVIANMLAAPEIPSDSVLRCVTVDPLNLRRIEAIKRIRMASGCGLLEAKLFTEGKNYSRNIALVDLDLTDCGFRIEKTEMI